MKTEKITEEEVADLLVASLPTRPNAPTSLGGRGYTAGDMKAAFDRLPLYIAERLNSLIEDISSESDGISADIKTGISDGHTLAKFFEDVKSGEILEYVGYGDVTLLFFLATLRRDVDALKAALATESEVNYE